MSIVSEIRFEQTTQLMLEIAPKVFSNLHFALKGGTAINLFLNDMPRLSVDIDAVLVDHLLLRNEALNLIQDDLNLLANRYQKAGFRCRVGEKDKLATCRIERPGFAQVKVEVNPVNRGTLFTPIPMALCPKATEIFDKEMVLPVLDKDEIYAGKFLAALIRQHPRDLYDVRNFFKHEIITERLTDCFCAYLAMGQKPFHEALFAPDAPQEELFHEQTEGMLLEPCRWSDLKPIRQLLQKSITESMQSHHKEFLVSLATCEPKFELLPRFPHLNEMPGIKWKLENLQKLQAKNPEKLKLQANLLANGLSNSTEIIQRGQGLGRSL